MVGYPAPVPGDHRSDSVVMAASSDWRLERQNRSDPGNRQVLQTSPVGGARRDGGWFRKVGVASPTSPQRGLRGPKCVRAATISPPAGIPRRTGRGERSTPKVRKPRSAPSAVPARSRSGASALPSSVFRLAIGPNCDHGRHLDHGSGQVIRHDPGAGWSRLSVATGEIHGFLGPNGAGKTTTLRILLGLARADSGTAVLLGR